MECGRGGNEPPQDPKLDKATLERSGYSIGSNRAVWSQYVRRLVYSGRAEDSKSSVRFKIRFSLLLVVR